VQKDRLVAFSDGVIAVIITIMVLELKAPHDESLGALKQAAPVFLSYVLSFIYVAIYWNNHHHFFTLVGRVSGAVLWANLHLLFWLSLIPFATSWLGEHPFAPIPTAVYGVSLLMPAIAWYGLQLALFEQQKGEGAALARSVLTSKASSRPSSTSPALHSPSSKPGSRTRSTSSSPCFGSFPTAASRKPWCDDEAARPQKKSARRGKFASR
jgi:uncharacterized membrane protein